MYEMDEKCRKCKNNGKAICNLCDMYYDEFDPIDEPKQTRADRIRTMCDEELAEFLEALCPSYEWTLALNGMTWFEFLKQEVSANDS